MRLTARLDPHLSVVSADRPALAPPPRRVKRGIVLAADRLPLEPLVLSSLVGLALTGGDGGLDVFGLGGPRAAGRRESSEVMSCKSGGFERLNAHTDVLQNPEN